MLTSSLRAVATLASCACILASPSETRDDACLVNGEKCNDVGDTMSALQAKVAKIDLNQSEAESHTIQCRNVDGVKFPCPSYKRCCGNTCAVKDGPCCVNYGNYKFSCGAGSTCCGNACAAPGSKCCNKGIFENGYEYPVAEGTDCIASVMCTNRKGVKFQCGVGSTCGGDICIGPGGVYCEHRGVDFACAPDNTCCGGTCASAQSKCCENKATGAFFPLTKATVEAPGIRCDHGGKGKR